MTMTEEQTRIAKLQSERNVLKEGLAEVLRVVRETFARLTGECKLRAGEKAEENR